jgi:hypothetical protein
VIVGIEKDMLGVSIIQSNKIRDETRRCDVIFLAPEAFPSRKRSCVIQKTADSVKPKTTKLLLDVVRNVQLWHTYIQNVRHLQAATLALSAYY